MISHSGTKLSPQLICVANQPKANMRLKSFITSFLTKAEQGQGKTFQAMKPSSRGNGGEE